MSKASGDIGKRIDELKRQEDWLIANIEPPKKDNE